MAATARILDFLRDRRPEGPCLVVDLEVIADNYRAFTRAMPDTRVFYAVKANPAPEILKMLADMGSCFDTASVPEIEMALAAGATPDRISFGNTIKKERDIARAHQLGVKLFAVDSDEEVEKVNDFNASVLLVEFLVFGPPFPREAIDELGEFLGHGAGVVEGPLGFVLGGEVGEIHSNFFIEEVLHAEDFVEFIGGSHKELVAGGR